MHHRWHLITGTSNSSFFLLSLSHGWVSSSRTWSASWLVHLHKIRPCTRSIVFWDECRKLKRNLFRFFSGWDFFFQLLFFVCVCVFTDGDWNRPYFKVPGFFVSCFRLIVFLLGGLFVSFSHQKRRFSGMFSIRCFFPFYRSPRSIWLEQWQRCRATSVVVEYPLQSNKRNDDDLSNSSKSLAFFLPPSQVTTLFSDFFGWASKSHSHWMTWSFRLVSDQLTSSKPNRSYPLG